jgi:hypothetical protein
MPLSARSKSRLAAVGDEAVSSLGSIRGLVAFVIACIVLDVQLRSLIFPDSPVALSPLLYLNAATSLWNGTNDLENTISSDLRLRIPIATSRTVQYSPLAPPVDDEKETETAEHAATDGSVENRDVDGT